MFKVPEKTIHEFREIFETHRLQISACNVYYQNIRLLNNHHKILNRDTYVEYYKNILQDIELVTSPIDAIIPADETVDELFILNHISPEYEKIKARVTLDDLYNTLPMTHEVVLKLKENPNLFETVLDDILLYFYLFKYLDQIDLIRLQTFSNSTPISEYIVENITEKDLKSFLISRRINEQKYVEKCADVLFNPDVTHTTKFYSTPHGDIPAFDVVNLMMRLTTNLVLKSDIYIIIGIYMTISFAITDIVNNKIDDSPCAKYVRDVLSKI